jgi:hypothetical protein
MLDKAKFLLKTYFKKRRLRFGIKINFLLSAFPKTFEVTFKSSDKSKSPSEVRFSKEQVIRFNDNNCKKGIISTSYTDNGKVVSAHYDVEMKGCFITITEMYKNFPKTITVNVYKKYNMDDYNNFISALIN